MPRKNRQVHTIQQTAKRFKAWQAVGIILLLAGAAWSVATVFSGAYTIVPAGATFIFGLSIYAVASIAAWWHHG